MNATITQLPDLSEKTVSTAKCPYCKEEIQEDALKCRHCGEILKMEEYSRTVGNSPMQQAILQVKAFSPVTLLGIAAVLVFTVLFFTTVTYRWWIMLPLAIGGIVALRKQVNTVSGLENKVCVGGFWIGLALLAIRDIYISNRICAVLDGFAGMANALSNL